MFGVLILALASDGVAGAEPPASLTLYRCYICHSDREPVVGPAFADIAASYHGRSDAVAKIARDIRGGIRGGGPWHMPPHPEVSANEARDMARYIMSLDIVTAPSHAVSGRVGSLVDVADLAERERRFEGPTRP